MNSILLLIILIPAIEIFLFIKIGSQIGAITTILLILGTAIIGIYYAKYQGLNVLKSGFVQISKNKAPKYEIDLWSCNCFRCPTFNNPRICNRHFRFYNFISCYTKFFFREIFK